jgi:hypothetical protein
MLTRRSRQLTLIPAEFLASSAIIAPNEHIADLLPNLAKQLGLNQVKADLHI